MTLLKSKTARTLLVMTIATITVVSCKKNENSNVPPTTKNSTSSLTKEEQITIAKAGFSPTDAAKVAGGYLVEGDIFLTLSALQAQKELVASISGKGPKTEQYRTTNTVTGLPRVIKVKVDAGQVQKDRKSVV